MQWLMRLGDSDMNPARKGLECPLRVSTLSYGLHPPTPWRYTGNWGLVSQNEHVHVLINFISSNSWGQWRAIDRVRQRGKAWHLTGAYCGPVAFTYTVKLSFYNGHSNAGDIIPTLWMTKLRVRGYNKMLLVTSLEFMLSARARIYHSKPCAISILNSKIC